MPPPFLRSLGLCLVLSAGLTCVRAQSGLPPPYDIDPTPAHPRSSEGSFAALASGRILFCYSQFSGGGADYSPSAIAQIHSDDQGRTWSRPQIVVPTGAYQNVMSVSFLRLADGKLARFYCVKRTKWLDCHPVMTISSDDGKTWSEPRPVTTAPGYFVLNNDRVIQTTSGRIIIPLAYQRSRTDRDDESAWDSRAIDLWLYSDDEGATWHESQTWWGMPVPSRSGLQEPGLVQLADGSLFSWCRTDAGEAYCFRSDDDGLTWSPPKPTTLKSPVSPASIKRLPHSSVLMAVYNDHSGLFPFAADRRTPLVAAFSTDGGRTWGDRRLIESDLGGWYCYTAIHFTHEGALIAYSAGNDHIGKLSRLRIRLLPWAWLRPPKG